MNEALVTLPIAIDKSIDKALVVKSNDLIKASYSLNLWQLRLWIIVLSKIDKDDQLLATYTVTHDDLRAFVGMKHKNFLPVVEKYEKDLIKAPLEIMRSNGDVIHTSFFSAATFKKGKPEVDFSFHHELKPFLLNIQDNFTKYELQNIAKLQSSNSIRIYQLMKEYENLKKIRFEIDELKVMLGLEGKYKKPNDFIRNVIDTAQSDLTENRCDVYFDYSTVKVGRKIAIIEFYPKRLKDKDAPPPTPALTEDDIQGIGIDEIWITLKSMGLTDSQISKHLEVANPPLVNILNAVEITKKKYKDGGVKNVAAYLYILLESGAEVKSPSFVNESEAENKADKAARAKAKKEASEKKRQAEKQKEIIEELKQEFQKIREEEQAKIIQTFEEKDWQAFKAYMQKTPVPTHFIVDGVIDKTSESYKMWVHIFVSDRYQEDFDSAFEKWVSNTKGFILKKNPRTTEYEIAGKQDLLF